MSLEERWKDGFVEVWCKVCGKLLVQFEEDTRKGWLISDCKHFSWKQVHTRCFYDYNAYREYCEAYYEPQYVEKLKRKYLLRVDDGERFFLLVPRDEGEKK